ncbi:MAG: hypothetical protein K6E21_00550 [Bacilli bacterium]|nr:hypothetical protein [Bacilli bacterium]
MGIRNLKKIKTKALILTAIASAFTMSILLPTFSWFNDDTASPISVDGNIHGSYFESGDGTAANPFEIARPIQLYYLSWLQEMGYFNEAVLDENTGEYVLKQQYHFYLSKDIDMIDNEENYVIPPIGTIKYPFVGSFDGKGHVITDLTISNDYSEYTKDPRHPTGSNTHSDSYEILGLFGVLGTTESSNIVTSSIINQDGTIQQLQDNGDDVLVEFSEAGNYVQNVYLNNVTIVASTDSQHALAGAVAGYSNATVAHVGIFGATLRFASGLGSVSTIGTTNLSDYAAFGFVTVDHKRTVDKIEETIYTPKATASTYVSNSSGSDWGGSVNFSSLNQRMKATLSMKVTNNSNRAPVKDVCLEYPIKQTYVNGTLQAQKMSTTPGNILNEEDIQDSYHYSDANATGKSGERNTIGSYYYTYRSSGRRIYLGGMSDVGAGSVKWVTRITEGAAEEAYYMKDSSNKYIGISDGEISPSDTINSDTAIFHYNSTDQSLYARKNDGDGVNTIYFLNVQNNSYLIETTNNTVWTKNTNDGTFTGQPKWKFKISYNGHYLQIDSTSAPTNTDTDTEPGTIWNISNHGTSNLESGIYATYYGKTYYLNYSANKDSNDNGVALLLYRAQYKSWKRSSQSETTNVTFKNDTKYLRYSNGWTTNTSTSSNNGTRLTLTKDTSTYTGAYETISDTSYTFTINQERSGQAGYIPLSANGDGNLNNYNGSSTNINSLYAAEINTGYITGGFYDSSNGGKAFLAGQYYGDARISQYDRTSISDSWNDSQYNKIYTIDDSCYNGTGDNATQKANPKEFEQGDATAQTFVKLDESLTNMDRILRNPLMNGSTPQISGIHFMASAISKERTIRADAVMINGDYKTDYELPEDAIDFNLKENGYINFLAGNYQSDNNSFFALHKIERDQNDDIISIKKIKYIFKDADDPLGDAIFLYDDEGQGYTWSDGETLQNRPVSKNNFTSLLNDKDYVFAFDTKWIAVNETLVPHAGKRLYYFEMPVNVGEYALGSCQGGCGSYLVYLDISAASQIIERKTLNELFSIETLSGEIPYGTQIVGSIPSAITDPNTNEEDKTAIVRPGVENIDDLDSYYGSISTSANGDYTFNRSSNTITVSGTNALTSEYVGDGITLSGSTSGGRTSRIIRRIIDYDYNTIIGTYVKQTTTIEIIGTGSSAHNYATTQLEYNMTDFDDPYTLIAIYSYDWVGDGPDFQYSYYLRMSTTQGVNNAIEVNFNNAANSDFYLTVKYLASNFQLTCGTNTSIIHSSDIPAVVDENNPYPQLQIPLTSATYDTPDKWYDFTKASGGYTNNEDTVTPTVVVTLHYTREGSCVVDEMFEYSGYGNMQAVSSYSETPQVITINNGSYTIEFHLSGSDPQSSQDNPAVTVYYLGNGAYLIQMANGSEYILFVDESQQQNP